MTFVLHVELIQARETDGAFELAAVGRRNSLGHLDFG
jgi:hypothetical protein